jgi:hypothetical protein
MFDCFGLVLEIDILSGSRKSHTLVRSHCFQGSVECGVDAVRGDSEMGSRAESKQL